MPSNKALSDENRGKEALRAGIGKLEELEGYDVSPEDIHRYYNAPETFGGEANNFLLGDSQLAGAQADRGSIDAQRQALSGLQGMATGMPNEGDIAAQNLMQMQQAQAAAGQRGALQQRMAQQGLGGSGAELAGQLSAQQGGTNAMAVQGAMLDQERSRRALAAMQAAGQQASGMRGQSFQEDATRGQAADMFNMDNMDWRRHAAGYDKDVQNQFGMAQTERMTQQANRQADQKLNLASAYMGGQSALADYSGASADRQVDKSQSFNIV